MGNTFSRKPGTNKWYTGVPESKGDGDMAASWMDVDPDDLVLQDREHINSAFDESNPSDYVDRREHFMSGLPSSDIKEATALRWNQTSTYAVARGYRSTPEGTKAFGKMAKDVWNLSPQGSDLVISRTERPGEGYLNPPWPVIHKHLEKIETNTTEPAWYSTDRCEQADKACENCEFGMCWFISILQALTGPPELEQRGYRLFQALIEYRALEARVHYMETQAAAPTAAAGGDMSGAEETQAAAPTAAAGDDMSGVEEADLQTQRISTTRAAARSTRAAARSTRAAARTTRAAAQSQRSPARTKRGRSSEPTEAPSRSKRSRRVRPTCRRCGGEIIQPGSYCGDCGLPAWGLSAVKQRSPLEAATPPTAEEVKYMTIQRTAAHLVLNDVRTAIRPGGFVCPNPDSVARVLIPSVVRGAARNEFPFSGGGFWTIFDMPALDLLWLYRIRCLERRKEKPERPWMRSLLFSFSFQRHFGGDGGHAIAAWYCENTKTEKQASTVVVNLADNGTVYKKRITRTPEHGLWAICLAHARKHWRAIGTPDIQAKSGIYFGKF